MAGRSATPATLGAHLRACREMGLAEAGDSAIGRVPQHTPDHRAFPAACPTRRYAFPVEPPRDLRDAQSLDRIHLIDAPHYAGLSFIDQIGGERLFRLVDITIAVRSAAHDAHFPRLGTVSLATPRALQDLGAFVFRNHALELNQELIFRAVAWWRLHEQGFDSLAGELFDQQNLVSILSAQSIGRVREHNLDLSFGGEIAHAFQTWALQCGSAIAFIFEDPLFGYLQLVVLGELDQRRRLACDCVLLALLLRRNPSIDRAHSHDSTPSRARQRGVGDRGPESRKPARASPRASDQTNMRYGFEKSRLCDAAQPCLLRVRRKTCNAAVTVAPMVRPLLFAYFRRSSTVLGGSFRVTGIVVSGISTGRSSWEAFSR